MANEKEKESGSGRTWTAGRESPRENLSKRKLLEIGSKGVAARWKKGKKRWASTRGQIPRRTGIAGGAAPTRVDDSLFPVSPACDVAQSA